MPIASVQNLIVRFVSHLPHKSKVNKCSTCVSFRLNNSQVTVIRSDERKYVAGSNARPVRGGVDAVCVNERVPGASRTICHDDSPRRTAHCGIKDCYG